jgi:enoyl-CoA hydratase/carnithine racemase
MENIESVILYERRNDVVTLWLNRPQQYNALSEDMLNALKEQLDVHAGDTTIRCLILAAKGKAFCAGHDLREMQQNTDLSYYQQLFSLCSEVMMKIHSFPVPVIARVQGVATAAGCQLVASCDLAVAVVGARFGVSGINLGLFCSTPSVALTRSITNKHALEMLFTGKFIDADAAVSWGLVNQAVDNKDIDSAVDVLTSAIAAKSAAAIRHGKAMIYRQRSMCIEDAYSYAAKVMACNAMEDDAINGINAFLSK